MLIDALNWRYATKKFDSQKKVDQELIDQIIEAGRLAPTSYGLQAFKIVDVQDPVFRQQIKGIAYNQPQIIDADRLIILMGIDTYSADMVDDFIEKKSVAQNINIENLDGFRTAIKSNLGGMDEKDFASWTSKQTYIVLGTMLSMASELEVDNCPIEGFDKQQLNELLNVEGYYPSVMLAIGYRDEQDGYQQLAKFRKHKKDLIIQK